MQQAMPTVYDYLDYRCFLKDRISELRQKGQFSFRGFNRKAGFKSSGALKLVMDGKRNLAQQGLYKVAKGLKLSSVESKFFNHLVLMNQAASHDEKDFHFRELITYRPFRQAREMTALQYDCLSHWYYAAILELVRVQGFQEDPDWIAKRLASQVKIHEIRRALADLEQLKLLTRNKEGKLERADSTFSTPDEVTSVSLVNFHQEMCDLAKRAVTQTHANYREFSSITIAVSEKGFSKIKSRMQEFKKEIDHFLEEDPEPRTQVAQVNLQFFPLTKEPLK